MSPTITVGSFFRHERSTFLFICSTTSNLNNFKPQQLQPQKLVQNEKKKENRRPQPRKHTKDPTLAKLFFGTMRLVLKFFGLHQRVPFICFDILQHNGCQKIAKGPPFTFFGTVTLFKNLIKNFFWGIFSCLRRVPLQFFFNFLQSAGVPQSPKGPPFKF